MSTPSAIHCAVCGRPYPAGAKGSMCPSCLLMAGMETQAMGPQRIGQKSTPLEDFIADLFPELERIKFIGRGGMGVVYQAHQRDLRRDIALKLLPLEHADRKGWEDRFEVEARAAARLDHPNIVTLYEFGTREGAPFLKMRLVEGGRSLADALKGQPRWPANESVELLIKVARAVHHAHQHGIIHRDLKPGNILLDASGEPYLMDFGLARFVEENAGLTGSHMVLGTANYMSPEQADGRNKDITTAADVHALGATMYEMLTGRPPFEGTSVADILRRVCEKDPTPPHVLCPQVDRDLSTICMKCLEKNPERRYRSAESLEEELERWREGRPIMARRISMIGRATKWARRRPGQAAMIATVVFALFAACAGFYYAWQMSERNRIAAEKRLDEALQGFTSEAAAQRMRGKAGHRWDAFDAIAKGVAIRVTPALRSEGVACLSLADMRHAENWRGSAGEPSCMSGDFTRVAMSLRGGGIEIRDYPTMQALAKLPAQTQPARQLLQFSPDGRLLASGHAASDQAVHLEVVVWDIARRAVLLRLPGVYPDAFDFSPDSRQIFAATATELQVWDVASKALSTRIPMATEPAAVRASPDGRRVAVSHPRGGVDFVDVAAAAITSTFSDCRSSFGIAWDAHGRRLAIPIEDGMVCIWDTAGSGSAERRWRAHTVAALRAAWHPNGHHLVTEGADEELILWEARLGERVVDLPLQSVGRLSFSPNGRRLGLFSNGDALSLLEVEDGGGVMRQSAGHDRRQIQGAAWHPSGLVMATCADDMVKFWNHESELVGTLAVASTRSVNWTVDSLIVTGEDGITQWPIRQAPDQGTPRRLVFGAPIVMDSRKGWRGAALCARDASPAGRIRGRWFAATHPDRILIVDLEGKTPPVEIHGQPNAAFASISPDESLLVTGSLDGADVHVWSLPGASLVRSLGKTGGANVLFSPDGLMLVTANNVEYKVWSTRDWHLIKSLPTHTGKSFGAIGFSPRMTALALESERNRLRILRPGDLSDLAGPDFDDQAPLGFSPNGVIMVDMDKNSHLIFWHLLKLRAGMSAIGLDWDDLPSYPPVPEIPAVESVEFVP